MHEIVIRIKIEFVSGMSATIIVSLREAPSTKPNSLGLDIKNSKIVGNGAKSVCKDLENKLNHSVVPRLKPLIISLNLNPPKKPNKIKLYLGYMCDFNIPQYILHKTPIRYRKNPIRFHPQILSSF